MTKPKATPAMKLLHQFLSAAMISGINGAEMREAMEWVLEHPNDTENLSEALRLAEHLEKFRSFPDDIAAAAELRRQHARIEQLEKSESDLITERDYRDEIIDLMADAVLGTDRAEWSSSYDLIDAAQEVEDFMVQVEATNTEVEKLKAEVEKLQQQLIAEAKKTAEEKLRADQLDKQHSMQSRMHAEAVRRDQEQK